LARFGYNGYGNRVSASVKRHTNGLMNTFAVLLVLFDGG